MSVGSIIKGGIGLVRTQPRTIAIWAALYLVFFTISISVISPAMASLIALQRQAAIERGMGMTVIPAAPSGMFGAIFLFDLVFCLFMLILFAAVVRAVVRPTDDRFGYLRIGMDELRLFGLAILFLIAGIVAEIVAALVVGVIAGILSMVIGKGGAIIVAILLVLVLIGAAIYAEVRLSLAGAFTVMRGRIVIAEAWRATKGRFWTLFGAYLLIGLAFMLISVAIIAISCPHLLQAYASMDPQAINAAAMELIARQAGGLSPATVIQIVISALLGTAMMAVAGGAVATAAIELQTES